MEKLQGKGVAKIEQLAKTNQLIHSKHLAFLLFRWRDWEKEKSLATEFVSNAITTTAGMLQILRGFLQSVQTYTMGDNTAKIEWQINIKNLAEFTDPHQIAKRLESLLDNDLANYDEETRIAVRAFKESYSQWLTLKGAE